MSMSQRGRKGSRKGRSASVSVHTPDVQHGVQLCGSCSQDVGDSPIGCDECEVWVHATEMCSGLPQDMIIAIDKYCGTGIKFVCMKCRVSYATARGGSPSSSTEPHMAETINQLFQQIKGLCSVVTELTNQVKELKSMPTRPENTAAGTLPPPTQTPTPTPAAQPQQPPQDYRTLIREEVREQKERDKRRDFVIVRGLAASSTTDFKQKFAQLTTDIMGTRVDPSEVFAISGHTNFYRTKIGDDESRKMVLDKAKLLKGTAYESVFISRDLTYAQRTELYQRRQAHRAQQLPRGGASGSGGAGGLTGGPSAAAVAAAPPTDHAAPQADGPVAQADAAADTQADQPASTGAGN